MKKAFLLLFLLLSSFCGTFAADGLCFKAIQNGVAVDVICAGQPVSFINCSEDTPTDATILFFPGPKDQVTSNSRTLAQGESYLFPDAGTFYVTLIITRGRKDENNQTITELLERAFEVKATPTPAFTATPCNNLNSILTIDDPQYDTYTIDYGDGRGVRNLNKEELPATYQYTAAGTYTITIIGKNKGASCSSPPATSTFSTLNAFSPPTISNLQVQEQDAASGSIIFTTNALYDAYTYTLKKRLEGEASFSTVTTLAPNQTIHTVSSLNTSIAAEYRIETVDACGTALSPSNTVSNIMLNVTAENAYNAVMWQSLGNFQRMELYRNGELLDLSSISNPFNDRDVVCGRTYTYQLKGITAVDTIISVSNERTVTATSTIIPPAGTLLATYNLNNQVELIFSTPEKQIVQEITIQRSVANKPPEQLIVLTSSTTYLDESNSSENLCYTATYKNSCVISELSQPVCPMLLTGEQVGGSVNLSWSAFVGFPQGIAAYEVEVLDENNQPVATYIASGTTYSDTESINYTQPVRYRIKATTTNNTFTYSNLIVVEQEAQLYIPSAFTPNGDGLNDKFEVKGQFIKSFSIRIFNGMGQVVYTSGNKEEGWDGNFKGTPLPAGAYAYEIAVTATGNKAKNRTGTVTLIR